MTTPRIEEMVGEFERLEEMCDGDSDQMVAMYRRNLRSFLTQAHQAGYADGYKQGKFDAEVTAEYGEPEALQDNK